MHVFIRPFPSSPSPRPLTHAGARSPAATDLLGDPSALDGFLTISPETDDIATYATRAVNKQRQQAASLFMGLKANVSNMLLRLSALYREAQAKQASKDGGATIDPSAIASLNKFLSHAMDQHVRKIPKGGGMLMMELKRELKKARSSSDMLLKSSHVTPLSLAERRRLWESDREQTEAARRDVRDRDITSWDSWRHVQVCCHTTNNT